MPPEKRNATGELRIDADGSVHVPAYALPLSAALSDHSRVSIAAALSRSSRMGIPRAEDFTIEADFKAMVDGSRSASSGPALVASATAPISAQSAWGNGHLCDC